MISVVIPAYNQGEYLEECIESVYNQTFPANEIIVVNDGSTDNTKEIAERYMFREFPGIESPVRVINQVNKGLPSARNTGIMNATGDYILFLDADDKLREDALAKLNYAIMKTNADIIAPSFKCFGRASQEVILTVPTIDEMKVNNRLGYFSAIKRSTLLEVGGYNPKMKWGYEDYDLWFDLFKRNKNLCVIQEPIVFYRVKEHSMIHTAQAHHEELMTQIKNNHPEIFR